MKKSLERRLKIYKALRHFGVSAEEMSTIAENYLTWLKLPIEDIRTKYKIVYFHMGKLYTFPFEIEALKDRLVGVAINNTVYFAYQEPIKAPFTNQHYDRLSSTLYKIFNLSMAEAFTSQSLKIELPNKEEISALYRVVNDSIGEHIHGKTIFDLTPHTYLNWWTATPEEKPKHIRVEAVNALGNPISKCKIATVQPVAHLRKDSNFVANINEFGVLDEKSLKGYLELLEKIKH